MRPIRPDDAFLLRTDTAQTPMQIGALQHYDVPEALRGDFLRGVRAHFQARLPATPLLSVRKTAPLGFDSDLWLDVASCDLDRHIAPAGAGEMTAAQLNAFVAEKAMQRLDLRLPPFQVYVADRLAEGGCALFIQVHHAMADGLGFQNIIRALTDATPDAPSPTIPPRTNERAPSAPVWLLRSALRFARESKARAAQAQAHARARETLMRFRTDPALKRAKPPTLKLSRANSERRLYETMVLPLARLRAAGKRHGGTLNDAFLAMCAGAIRASLIAIDDLPAVPLVAVSARSYRKPEHGEYGNRIVSLHPQLATHIADPQERFKTIQRAMAIEIERSLHEEVLLGALEIPFGPRRRAKAAAEQLSKGRVLPGNVTLSNVPGPAEPRYLAGFRQMTNFPTPILGTGSFLNITMRRCGEDLNLGIMADAEKLTDLRGLKQRLIVSLEELENA